MLVKLIVCLTGMPGSGKSTIVSALKARGLEALNLGDGVRAEAKKRNLEPTGENLGKLMLELRDKNGPGAVANLLTEQIKNSKSEVIIIDGVRSTAEIEVLKNVGT
ncbi:MAG TPA: dephospho-CoA kinase, partial [Candidatus Marinimicrobia bacterium]|nr:dephospho-CoA kinase [Candidatus Neomarinimicrobiota bacterium]